MSIVSIKDSTEHDWGQVFFFFFLSNYRAAIVLFRHFFFIQLTDWGSGAGIGASSASGSTGGVCVSSTTTSSGSGTRGRNSWSGNMERNIFLAWKQCSHTSVIFVSFCRARKINMHVFLFHFSCKWCPMVR